MSLMSLIGSNSSTTTSSASTLSPLQQLIATNSAGTTKTNASTTQSSVSISAAAKIAAAEVADNAKDFTALGTEVRATLDAQYAADKTAGQSAKPDLSEMSGRALAAIALNKSKGFSSGEVAAAKAELRTRTREQFTASVGTGSGAALSGIAAYNQQLVSQYDAMSGEEREALGWTSNVRASAAAFVGTSSQTSLFDQLGDIGDASDY